MDRFQILKGEKPPESKFKHWNKKCSISVIAHIPEEAKTIVNGQSGWLSRNGTFYSEETIRKISAHPLRCGCESCGGAG